MKKLSLFGLLCFISTTSSAQIFQYYGINYNILDSDLLTAEVVANTHDPGMSLYGYGSIVSIPATVEHDFETYHVVQIADGAFKDSENLYSVILEMELRKSVKRLSQDVPICAA